MFYDNFIRLCELRGEKPSPVAQKLGCTTSNVALWKKGSTPRPAVLQKFADYFNVPVQELLFGVEKIPLADLINSEGDPVKEEMYHMMSTATQEELRDMLELMRFVKRKRKDG